MKKPVKILIPILIIAGVTVWLIVWMRSPSEGIITPKMGNTQTNATQQSKHLDGEYLAFQYSGKYVAGSNSPANNDLERYTLSAGTNYDKRVQVAVVKLPESRLETNGDYIYRQKTPSLYTKRQLSTAAGLFDIWVKQDGSEQTAFAAHGTKAAVVSFTTSPSADNSLTSEVDTFLNSVQWKQ